MEQAAGSPFLSSKVFLLILFFVHKEKDDTKAHFRSSDTPLRMLSRPGWKVMDT